MPHLSVFVFPSDLSPHLTFSKIAFLWSVIGFSIVAFHSADVYCYSCIHWFLFCGFFPSGCFGSPPLRSLAASVSLWVVRSLRRGDPFVSVDPGRNCPDSLVSPASTSPFYTHSSPSCFCTGTHTHTDPGAFWEYSVPVVILIPGAPVFRGAGWGPPGAHWGPGPLFPLCLIPGIPWTP